MERFAPVIPLYVHCDHRGSFVGTLVKMVMHYSLKTRACIDNPAYHALHEFYCTTWDLYAPGLTATQLIHYSEVTVSTMSSQITSVSIVFSTVCSGQTKENMKSMRLWPMCGEFTDDRRIPRTRGQLRWKMFPFDFVIMTHENAWYKHPFTIFKLSLPLFGYVKQNLPKRLTNHVLKHC